MHTRPITLTLILIFSSISFLNGQSPPINLPLEIKELHASDGIFEDYVLIRWQGTVEEAAYQVYRNNKPQTEGMELISKSWQKSTWLADYEAEAGKQYYYGIKVKSVSGTVKQVNDFDVGYVKKPPPIANEDQLLSYEDDVLATPKKIVHINNFGLPDTVGIIGDLMEIDFQLENVQPDTLKELEIRFFLSSDIQLDWDDSILNKTLIPPIPSGSTFNGKRPLEIPTYLSPGAYYLFLVASFEGKIFGSTVERTFIKLE